MIDTAAKINEAAAYGRTLGRNAAASYFAGIDGTGARRVLGLIAAGAIGDATGYGNIGERVTARSLARDLKVRPGTNLAREMHAAMLGAFDASFRERAADVAENALPSGDAFA